jgi:flagellar motor switch protein FliN/FliY
MADDNELINQADIEALLKGAGAASASKAPAAPNPAPKPPAGGAGELDQSEIEKVLAGNAAVPSRPAATAPAAVLEDADRLLGQDDIEKLLSQAGAGGSAADHAAPSRPASVGPSAAGSSPVSETISQGDVEFLFRQAEKALESVTSEQKEIPPSAAPFLFSEFSGSPASTEVATLDLLNDVELDLKIELGRTNMYLEDVLKLRRGAVVPLDKLAGDPVDIYVNGRLIARGEVLVLNDNFCVRVAELVASTTPVV